MGGGAAEGLWRHQQWLPSWPPSWILPRITSQVKTARNGDFFCAWHETRHINKRFSLFYPQDLLLSLKKIRKKALLVLSLKMAWPPPTYDVISRNPRNWPLLNLTQNAPEGWTNSYWKRPVPMFYPLRENSAKPLGGWHPPPLARPRVKVTHSSFILRSRCTSCKCIIISPICSLSILKLIFKKVEDWKHGRLKFHYMRSWNYHLLIEKAKRKHQLK